MALLVDDHLGGGREQPGPPLPDAYITGFRRMTAQKGRIILAMEGGAVIGCLQLDILHGVSIRAQTRAQVEGVRVASHCRGQGVGRLLLGEAIAQARAAGAGVVQLTTNQARTDAQRFYRSLGFSQSHVGMKLDL